jgi:hypothetical protein
MLALVVVGCGVTEKKIQQARQQVDSLQAKGVPDSVVSNARLYLKQAETATNIGNARKAGDYYDSALTVIEQAQDYLKNNVESLKPVIDSMRTRMEEQIQDLTGLHRKTADSLLTRIDTLLAHNRILQAKATADKLETRISDLYELQKRAEEIREKLQGTWKTAHEATCKGCDAVSNKYVTFNTDSTFKMIEAMEGRSKPRLKEKWKFISTGPYRVKGDTVYMKTTHEKCPVQVYWHYKEEDGKKQWVKTEKPTYDSSMTENPKRRSITYEDLSTNWKKQ